MRWRSRLIKLSVNALLRAGAVLARSPRLEPLSTRWWQTFAAARARLAGIRPAASLEELGAAWQRGFPSAKQVPITGSDARTVYAEIHTPCPLRGSGDVHACHRMMAYDRSIAAKAGGQFFVLRSQAEPGVTVCSVALRFRGEAADGLVEAHRRTP